MRPFLIFVVLLTALISACKKDDPDTSGSVHLKYEDRDSNGNYQTQFECELFAHANGVYLDSLFIVKGNELLSNSHKYDYRYFNSPLSFWHMVGISHYFANSVGNEDFTPMLAFDSTGRIQYSADSYNIATNESPTCGYEQYNYGYMVYPPSPDTIFAYVNACVISPNPNAFQYGVSSYSADSMVISWGDPNFTPQVSCSYTVYFEDKINNTNLLLLSGYVSRILAQNIDLASDSATALAGLPGRSFVFDNYIAWLPFPKLNMPLAKSIRIKTIDDQATNILIHFTYEFDSNNRVTKATITNNNKINKRVQISY